MDRSSIACGRRRTVQYSQCLFEMRKIASLQDYIKQTMPFIEGWHRGFQQQVSASYSSKLSKDRCTIQSVNRILMSCLWSKQLQGGALRIDNENEWPLCRPFYMTTYQQSSLLRSKTYSVICPTYFVHSARSLLVELHFCESSLSELTVY